MNLQILFKSGIRFTRIRIVSNFDPNKNPSAVLPITPILSTISFTANDLRKIAEKINSENWIDLFLVQLDDLPLFE